MAKITTFQELEKLIKALLPDADVVVDIDDMQVVILTGLSVNLDGDPDLLISA